MRWILPAVLLLFLTLLTGTAKAHAFAPFQPSFDLLSISNPSPGAHADVVHRYAAPQGDHVIGSVKYTLPIENGLAADAFGYAPRTSTVDGLRSMVAWQRERVEALTR